MLGECGEGVRLGIGVIWVVGAPWRKYPWRRLTVTSSLNLYQQISWEYLECSGERGDVTHPAPPPPFQTACRLIIKCYIY
jgi:hypothetical protein